MTWRSTLGVACLGSLGGCALSGMHDPSLDALPSSCSQALVVRADGVGSARATVVSYERCEGRWRARDRRPATVGRSGIVAAAAKREGDGGTPAGMHAIGPAFGYAPTSATKLVYRQATAQDWWIDDPRSLAYNTWVVGKPDVSAEAMRRDDGQYELGAVLGWNTSPVVAGRGSAIFLHVWQAPDVATSGCVALARADVERMLAWLDATCDPRIVVVAP